MNVPPQVLFGASPIDPEIRFFAPLDNAEIRFFARQLEQLRGNLYLDYYQPISARRVGDRVKRYPVNRHHPDNTRDDVRRPVAAVKWTRHDARRWCRRLAPLVEVAHDCVLEERYAEALAVLTQMLPRDEAVRWVSRGIATVAIRRRES